MQTGQGERQSLPPLHQPKVAIPAERAKAMRLVTRAQALVDQAMEDPDALIVWPGPISDALNKLTGKQRQYAIRTGAGQPAESSYRMAYDVSESRDDNQLSADISHLNSNPRVKQAQLMLREWLGQKWLLDGIEVKDWGLSKLYEEASWAGKASDRIKATELLLKAHGHLVDKKEITHRDVNEMDEQAQLFRSILADVNLSPVLDAEYVVQPQQLTGPSLGYVCPACNSRAKLLSAEYEDGDGI